MSKLVDLKSIKLSKCEIRRKKFTNKINVVVVFFFCFIGGVFLRFVLDSTSDNIKIFQTLRDKRGITEDGINEKCHDNSSICMTPECVKMAASLLENMDITADPCTDFFRYACGGWIDANRHKVGESRLYYAVNLDQLQTNVDIGIKELLKKVRLIPEEFYAMTPYKQMFTFYDSCLNTEPMNTQSTRDKVFKFIKNIDGFQIDKPFEASSWNLTVAIVNLMKLNGVPLFDLALEMDVTNSNNWIPVISSPRRYGLMPSLHNGLYVKSTKTPYKNIQNKKKKTRSKRNIENSEEINILSMEDSSDILNTSDNVSQWLLEIIQQMTIDRKDIFEAFQSTMEIERQHAVLMTTSQLIKEWSIMDTFVSDPASSMLSEEDRNSKITLNISNEIDTPVFSKNKDHSNGHTEDLANMACGLHQVHHIPIELAQQMQSSLVNLNENFLRLFDEIVPTKREELISMQSSEIFTRYSIQQLQTEFPMIEWQFLFQEVFNSSFSDSTEVVVNFPNFMKKLNTLLQTGTPWTIHWGILALYFHDVIDEMKNSKEDNNREEFCSEVVKNTFSSVVTHMYLHDIGREVVQDAQKQFNDVMPIIKETLISLMNEAEWLPETEREYFKRKLYSLNCEVGAHDDLWDISHVENLFDYGKLNMKNDDFFGNVNQLYKYFRKNLFALYHSPLDRNVAIWDLTVHPYIVNALKILAFNTIVLPQAFFIAPFYSRGAPDYINYGTIATAISHEIFHGFDLAGIKFDQDGIMKEELHNSTFFNKLATTSNCFHDFLVKNYQKVEPFQGSRVLWSMDSNATFNENLADIFSIQNSFKSYQKISASKSLQKLPAISHSNDELFFISAAQPYCAVLPSTAKLFLLELDDHLPNDIRMNAMMMNSPDFRKTFQCSRSSPETHTEFCSIF